MTIRYSAHTLGDATLVALWLAGGCVCSVCALDLVRPGMIPPNANREPTVEHVFPKSPRAADMRKIKALRALAPGGRKAMAHAKCNRRKGNRPPTGCEVVFLMAVNARLPGLTQSPTPPAYATPSAKRAAKRRRAAERKRLQETTP